MTKVGLILIPFFLIFTVHTIDLPLKLGGEICTVIMSSFDVPVKIDLRLPAVPNRKVDQNFKLSILSMISQEITQEIYATPQTTLRKSIELQPNVIYQLCISFESQQEFEEQAIIYIPFTQAEDFQHLIGTIQIPNQLASEKNLQQIYNISKQLQGIAAVIAKHQSKQRELQDQIVAKDIHKSKRIVTLSVIECFVIVLSGIYQIFALRKFLIEKNLY